MLRSSVKESGMRSSTFNVGGVCLSLSLSCICIVVIIKSSE